MILIVLLQPSSSYFLRSDSYESDTISLKTFFLFNHDRFSCPFNHDLHISNHDSCHEVLQVLISVFLPNVFAHDMHAMHWGHNNSYCIMSLSLISTIRSRQINDSARVLICFLFRWSWSGQRCGG